MEHTEAAGILLARRAMGDKSEMLTVFTAQHGIIVGVSAQQPRAHIPIGSVVHITAQQRVPTQMARFGMQLLQPYPAYALLNGRLAVAGIQLVCDILLHYVPDNVPLPLYDATTALLHGHAAAVPHIAHTHALWEKELLQHLGHLADTDRCYSMGCDAATVYLSPRTARGACAAHGLLWKERLLPYPQLWRHNAVTLDTIDELERVLPLLWRFTPHARRTAIQISRDCYIAALRVQSHTV
jgi:recombinational DNA repair protein (RecF pathway)